MPREKDIWNLKTILRSLEGKKEGNSEGLRSLDGKWKKANWLARELKKRARLKVDNKSQRLESLRPDEACEERSKKPGWQVEESKLASQRA
ncbi:hypothetical protein J6590_060768 [Homalodisca vitripennis]|nr:hypothetical protein J6590_060768 [Homalodisca vitripennis]